MVKFPPEFDITVTDDGRLTTTGTAGEVADKSTTVEANIISFQNTNDAPVFVDQDGATAGIQLGPITVAEDSFTPVTTSIISATDADLPAGGTLTFTVSNVVGGDFTLNGTNAANITTTFTQNDIESGLVFFINNGENTDNPEAGVTPDTISYDIKVSDGSDFTTNSGTGTITPIDDAPALETNQFAITEGVEFQVTTAQLNAIDPDTPNTKLRFIIGGDDKNSFLFDDGISKVADNNFTLQEVLDGKIFFLYEGEDTPTFTITVKDQTTTLPAVDGNIDFTPVNDAPELTVTIPGTPAQIAEDGSFFIDPTVFALTDAEFAAGLQTADELVYTYEATNGFFTDGTLVTDPDTGEEVLNRLDSFTQTDVIAGNVVKFVQDGSETAPSFSVTLNDNGFTLDGTEFPTSKSVTVDVEAPTDFTFVSVNDLPELIVGDPITVIEGKTVILGLSNLTADDEETNALDLTFEVTSVTNGQFSVDGGLTFEPAPTLLAPLTFTVTDVLQNRVIFKHDDSGETPTSIPAPSFDVRVIDVGSDAGTDILGDPLADATSAIATVDIAVTPVNDAPVLNETFETANDGIPFRISENQNFLLNTDVLPSGVIEVGDVLNINAIDPDTLPENLTYTVSGVLGGFFAFATTPEAKITQFTQAQLNTQGVVFNHDGSSTAPSYTLKVSDGTSFDTEFYTAELVTVNDPPEIKNNTLTLSEEDAIVPLTTVNIFATDEETGPANLKYSVDNLTNGTFLRKDIATGDLNLIIDADPLDGFDLTDAFTQQDVINQLIFFKYDGSGDAPTYTLIVEDDGSGAPIPASGIQSTTDAADIIFTQVNDAPEPSELIAEADFGIFDILQGGTTLVTKDDILVVDEEDYQVDGTGTTIVGNPASIVFTVDDVQNGFFTDGTFVLDPDTGETVLKQLQEFTQADINQGKISFVHDGSENAPTYELTATDQGLTTLDGAELAAKTFNFTVDLAVTFTNANDAPVLGNNQLTVNEGATNIPIEVANLSATDTETNAFDLTFNIASVTNGFFTVAGATPLYFGDPTLDGTPLDPNGTDPLSPTGSFTYEDVVLGKVTFTHDGTEDAPTYSVTVTDQVEPGVDGAAITTTPPEFATIAFDRENDAPTLQQTTGPNAGDPLVALTVAEGGKATVTLANIDAIDEAGETPQANLTFSISNVLGGSFIDIAGNITGTAGQPLTAADTFTRSNIQNGDLRFENDSASNDPPTYTITVTDDDPLGDESASITQVGTLTATNDEPVQVTLGTIALTEGNPFTINNTVLKFTDEESTAENLTYTVDPADGGDFFLSSDLDNAIASFTQADVNAGKVVFVDDGDDDTPPTFTLTLKDQGIATDPTINEVILTDADFAVAANFTPVNDFPEPVDPTIPEGDFVLSFPTVIENTPIAVVSTAPVDATQVQIAVNDEESSPAELKYTVSNNLNGGFTVNNVATNTFTQADIDNGLVAFVPLGDEAPTFTLTLQDNNGGTGANELTQDFAPVFELANQAPTITKNTLSPIEGQVVPFNQNNLAATDREDQVTDLTFQIVNVIGGTFFLNGALLDTTDDATPATKFTIFQLSSGALSFKDDGDEALPSYDVIVSDGTDPTGPVAATIDATNFPVNDLPEIVTANFPLTEGQLLELTLANLETADDDVDFDPNDALNASTLTYTVSGPTGGAVIGGNFVELLVDPGTGAITVEPVTTFTQQDVIDGVIGFQADDVDTAPSFKITVNDGAGGTDSVVIVDDPADPDDGIVFEPVNDPPAAVDDSFNTDQNTSLANLNVTANDSDDGDPPVLNVTKINGQASPVTLVSGATVTINGDNTLNYTLGNNFKDLAAGEQATETFTYTISDGDADNDAFGSDLTATVTITIEGLNDAPTAVADSATVLENADIELLVLKNDNDPDTNDTLSISSIDTTGTVGTVTTNGTSIRYDPRGAFTLGDGKSDTDTFTYTINDESGVTSTATVTVTVNGVNDAPVAVDDEFSTLDNVPLTGLDLTSNDTDADGDPLTIIELNGETKAVNDSLILALGTVTLTSGSTVGFTPAAGLKTLSVGQSEEETFTYTVQDGKGGTSQASVTLVVNGANEAPVANDDVGFSTLEGLSMNLNVLANDTDIDVNDVLTISSVNTAGLFGTVTNNGTNLSYTSSQALRGGQTIVENFTYTVSDGNGGTDTAAVAVSVTGVNEPPVATPNSGTGFITNEATAFTTASVLTNDFDPEGGPLGLVGLNTLGTRGLVTNNGNGTFTYDPNGVFNTVPVGRTAFDSFSYTIADDAGATATTTVTITINGLLSDFFDYEQQLRYRNLSASIPTDAVDVLPLAQLFDERYYLNQNPDVAAVVGPNRPFSSGYQHFVNFGINEGRNPSVLFNEAFYLSNNPDVAASVASPGGFRSGLQHFLLTGHRDARRDPSAFFDQSDYLVNNPDVATAIGPNGFASAFQHYILIGADEQRLPNLSLFNDRFYLANNPDVAGAGIDPFTHFVVAGQFEGRRPSSLYSETSYLANNPVVAAAIGPNGFASGFDHYQQFGRFEGRAVF